MSELNGIDTRADLVEWVKENMPGASVHSLDDEIIIHTGLTISAGDYLEPIESLDE